MASTDNILSFTEFSHSVFNISPTLLKINTILSKMKKSILSLAILALLFSCKTNKETITQNTATEKTNQKKGERPIFRNLTFIVRP